MIGAVADELLKVVDQAAVRLRLIDETALSAKPRPDAWSVKEILGHLLDSAANNHQRFVRALEADRLTFPSYEQDEWVTSQDYGSATWPELIEFWRLYNRHLAHIIRRIPEEKLEMECRLGANGPVTLGHVIEHYMDHLQHHLKQIEERSAV